ncbi:HTH_Tnp_Tc3_2 domain-containing protein [Trichonephila clavipes]|uniref:HTH_Tnp_Tc3_2 domain-containing protein n=1 Tax=Trichonephila clavipes TaxID=2585209 RepID=A0A8X6VWV4_TRICX|nr:HTH_Tnp_Tc3_2 domain-containing protein [Trichonephila clavipes]
MLQNAVVALKTKYRYQLNIEKELTEGQFLIRHDGSGRPRVTEDQEDTLIVRSAVTAIDSSLSTIRRTTRRRVSTMYIHRRLIERNLRSYRPLRHLPFTPAHCQARLPWCLNRSGGNHADWGR